MHFDYLGISMRDGGDALQKKRCFRCFKFDCDQSVNLKVLFTNILKTLYLMPVNFILN